MLVKLTYYGTDRPTLVNLENVESIYQVFDKVSRRYSTKICFKGNESYINVEEDLQTILRLDQETKEGHYQSHVWETPSLEERMETNYNQYKGRSNQYVPRERNYNRVDYLDRQQNDWI
jgi:hypothetical protein